MQYANPSRKVLARAVALVVATIVGPLAVPAVADPGGGTVTGTAQPDPRSETGTGTAALPPDSEVVMARATGFLSSSPTYDLL